MKKSAQAISPGPITLDVLGLSLTAADRERILHPLTGGVILFARNFSDREQLLKLTTSIKTLRPDVLISIDHEGGRVQRCKKDGFTHLPAMGRLGELWLTNRKKPSATSYPASEAIVAMQAATACGYVLAAELRACGVDFSFTPVLDLDFQRSGVIGDRSFSRDPQIVFALAKSLNAGLQMAGMANCGKHFPGHGWAKADSHVAIPVDERPLKKILNDDVKPAHVIYPQVDQHPAGFSAIWLQAILRQQLAFQGVIFSDDLAMEGASVAGDVVKAAQMALRAGCDAVLICNRPDLADRLLAELQVTNAKLLSSRQRLQQLMPKFSGLNWDELQQQVEYIQAKKLLSQLRLI